MTQAERDRLVTLKKAKKRLITQREAAEELGVSTRQVKRLLQALKKRGDRRYGEKYLPVTVCAPAEKKRVAAPVPLKDIGRRRPPRRGSDWNRNFDLKKAPKIWQAAQAAGRRTPDETM